MRIEITNRSVNTGTKLQGNTDIYYKGVEDGEKFSISDKITEGETEEPLALQG